REERGEHGSVADATVEAQPDDGLDLLRPSRGRPGIESADLLPVVAITNRTARAGAMAIRSHLVALRAPPGLHRIAAAGRELQEIGPIALGEAEGGLGQPGRGAVDGREVAPEGIGHAVHGIALHRGRETLTTAHLFHP